MLYVVIFKIYCGTILIMCLVNTKKRVCATMALQLLKTSLSHWERHNSASCSQL